MADTDREAVMRAARAYDEIEGRMQDLQRQLDEAIAHRKAGEQLIAELRLELAEARTAISTYRFDAEQARADQVAIMGCLADARHRVGDLGRYLDGFEIPSERLPMRRKPNGKPADAPEVAGGMADNPVNAPRAGGDPALATGTDGQSDGQL